MFQSDLGYMMHREQLRDQVRSSRPRIFTQNRKPEGNQAAQLLLIPLLLAGAIATHLLSVLTNSGN